MPIEQTDHSSRRKLASPLAGHCPRGAARLLPSRRSVARSGRAPSLRFLGGLAGGLLILLWWLFFSRAPWSERIGAIGLMAVATLVTSRFLHISIGDPGKTGRSFQSSQSRPRVLRSSLGLSQPRGLLTAFAGHR